MLPSVARPAGLFSLAIARCKNKQRTKSRARRASRGQIDRQALAFQLVEPEPLHSGFNRRLFVGRLDDSEELHPAAPDYVHVQLFRSGSAGACGGGLGSPSWRFMTRSPRYSWMFRFGNFAGGHVNGRTEIEVADPAQHFRVGAVFHHDRIVELLALHPHILSGGGGMHQGHRNAKEPPVDPDGSKSWPVVPPPNQAARRFSAEDLPVFRSATRS
jgi:hypothetical protein